MTQQVQCIRIEPIEILVDTLLFDHKHRLAGGEQVMNVLSTELRESLACPNDIQFPLSSAANIASDPRP